MVGYLTSTDRYFRISNGEGYRGTESHFGVGGIWGPDLGVAGGVDGSVWQWQDLDFQADANYEGNGEVISIETADNAVRPIVPWTVAQINSIAYLCAWLCKKYSIPPVLIGDTLPGRRGLAYHAQGAAERVQGGVRWSTTSTKDCPTTPRIQQFKGVVIPLVRHILDKAGVDMETDPVLQSIEKQLEGLYANGFAARKPDGTPDPTHEEISIRGLNVEMKKIYAVLVEIRDELRSS
jgi:hypothetical protein